MNKNEFGEFLKSLRKKSGYTLSKLKEVSGVSQPFLSQIERGERNPSPEVLKKISVAFNVSYEELMERAGYLEKTDLDKLEEAITKLESWLYTRYTQKKYWDSLKKGEIKGEEAAIYDNNEKFIYAFESSLLHLKKLRDQITDPFEKIEGIEEIINDALYPSIGYEFETPDFSEFHLPKLTGDQATQIQKKKHTFVFEVPASIESTVNGKRFIMPMPKKMAERAFYDVANLLNLSDKINLNGRTLSTNDIEKILSKIEEMKDEFEYLD